MNSNVERQLKSLFPEVEDLDAKTLEEGFQVLIDRWLEKKGSIVIFLIYKFKNTLPAEVKQLLISYIILMLRAPELSNQPEKVIELREFILIEPLIDNLNVNFDTFIECLEEISKNEDSIPVFTKIIYKLASMASKKTIDGDSLKYVIALQSLINLTGVKNIFKNEQMWGIHFNTIIGTRKCFLNDFLDVFLYRGSNYISGVPLLLNKSKRVFLSTILRFQIELKLIMKL